MLMDNTATLYKLNQITWTFSLMLPSRLPIIFCWKSYFILVDICSEGLNRLRNSDLIVKNICGFIRQNVSSKFCNTGKLIPFVFAGANMVLKK